MRDFLSFRRLTLSGFFFIILLRLLCLCADSALSHVFVSLIFHSSVFSVYFYTQQVFMFCFVKFLAFFFWFCVRSCFSHFTFFISLINFFRLMISLATVSLFLVLFSLQRACFCFGSRSADLALRFLLNKRMPSELPLHAVYVHLNCRMLCCCYCYSCTIGPNDFNIWLRL